HGRPSVVAAVTAETLRLHRGLAVERHRRSLQDLARRLSLSGRRCPPPAALTAWLEGRRPLPARVAYLEARYANEPYRLALALIAADLETASQEDVTTRLLDDSPYQAHVTVDELRTVLDLIAQAIPPILARDRLRTVRAQVETFGLHAARSTGSPSRGWRGGPGVHQASGSCRSSRPSRISTPLPGS